MEDEERGFRIVNFESLHLARFFLLRPSERMENGFPGLQRPITPTHRRTIRHKMHRTFTNRKNCFEPFVACACSLLVPLTCELSWTHPPLSLSCVGSTEEDNRICNSGRSFPSGDMSATAKEVPIDDQAGKGRVPQIPP